MTRDYLEGTIETVWRVLETLESAGDIHVETQRRETRAKHATVPASRLPSPLRSSSEGDLICERSLACCDLEINSPLATLLNLQGSFQLKVYIIRRTLGVSLGRFHRSPDILRDPSGDSQRHLGDYL